MSTHRGYIALMSVLLYSALLTTLVAVVSTDLYAARLQLTEERNYYSSRIAAYTCLQLALRSLHTDSTRFTEKDPITIFLSGQDSCSILGASTTGAMAGVVTTGVANSHFTRMYGEGIQMSSSSSYVLRRWEEY